MPKRPYPSSKKEYPFRGNENALRLGNKSLARPISVAPTTKIVVELCKENSRSIREFFIYRFTDASPDIADYYVFNDKGTISEIAPYVAAYVRENFIVEIDMEGKTTPWFWHFGDCLDNSYRPRLSPTHFEILKSEIRKTLPLAEPQL